MLAGEEKLQYCNDTPGNVSFEAAEEGRVLFEAALTPFGAVYRYQDYDSAVSLDRQRARTLPGEL